MIKREELTDPKSCMSRAADDEMTFVLLARDEAAPGVIRYWCAERVAMGKNDVRDPQILEALSCARKMEVYRKNAVTSTSETLSEAGSSKSQVIEKKEDA